MRRSLLFLPGNSPVMLQNGAVMPADALIMDLEAAVAPDQKDAARLMVTSALRSFDYSQEIIVRLMLRTAVIGSRICQPWHLACLTPL